MEAGSREINRPRAVAVAFFEGMDAVEPDPPGILAIGLEIGERPHMPAAVPFLARGGAGMAADADIEVDDEAKLFLALLRRRQRGHAPPPSPP